MSQFDGIFQAHRYNRVQDLHKAEGAQRRRQILDAMADGQGRSAAQLARKIGASQAAIRPHLSRLADKGLLAADSSGRFLTYRLAAGAE